MLTITVMTLIGFTCYVCYQQQQGGKEAAMTSAFVYLILLGVSSIFTYSVNLDTVTLQLLICMFMTAMILLKIVDMSWTETKRLINNLVKELRDEKLSEM